MPQEHKIRNPIEYVPKRHVTAIMDASLVMLVDASSVDKS
jgi:hypothetical protein